MLLVPLCLQAVNRRNQRVLTLFYLFFPSAEQGKQPHVSFPTGKYYNTTRAPTFGKKRFNAIWKVAKFPSHGRQQQSQLTVDMKMANKLAGAVMTKGKHHLAEVDTWACGLQVNGLEKGKKKLKICRKGKVAWCHRILGPLLQGWQQHMTKCQRINKVTTTTKTIQSNWHWVWHLSFLEILQGREGCPENPEEPRPLANSCLALL